MIKFDKSEEIIKSSHVVKKMGNITVPPVALICFDMRLFDKLTERYNGKIIAFLPSSNTPCPVYEIKYKGNSFTAYKSSIGGPCIAAAIEELSAVGVKKFVMFGSGGSLDKTVTSGNYIIPHAAFRDDGISYHYAQASDYINIDTWKITSDFFKNNKIPFAGGKTWTTDAFYRETVNKYKERKKEGCVVVEMEAASAAAVAQFRGLELYCFLWTADTLDTKEWTRTDKTKINEKFFGQTAEIAVKLTDYIKYK
jgi:uridine phosphorylase